MVKDYACQIYLKVHEQYRALETDGASRAKALAAWIARLRQEWQNIRIEAVEQAPDATPGGWNRSSGAYTGPAWFDLARGCCSRVLPRPSQPGRRFYRCYFGTDEPGRKRQPGQLFV